MPSQDAPVECLELSEPSRKRGMIFGRQIMFLKGADLLPFRSAVTPAVESRHEQVRKLRDDMMSGIGEERGIDR